MKEKLLELLWDLENYKYPDYNKKADEILLLFSVIQQREQLLAYHKHLDSFNDPTIYNATEDMIDDYLANIVKPFVMRSLYSDGDWTEDFSHENGNYINACIVCKNEFMGHKRRVVCRVCALGNDA